VAAILKNIPTTKEFMLYVGQLC